MDSPIPTLRPPQPDIESQLREMNEALIVSSVRQHELVEKALKAESSLRESEQRFRLMAETMPQKVFTANPAGTITYLSPQWSEFAGGPVEEMKDKGWVGMVHPDCVEQTVQTWRHSLDSGEPFLFEHRLVRSDGTEQWNITRALPLKNESGQITAWVGSSTDVNQAKLTEAAIRRRLEQEVVLRTAELLSSNEQLQGFTYSIAHDLRQQIRGISTNASTLMLDLPEQVNQENQHRLHRLVRSAKQLSDIVDDLLAYARLGKHEPLREHLDLSAIAQEVSTFLVDEGRCSNCTQFKIEPGVAGEGDPTMIRMVIENLLDNACKYSYAAKDPLIEFGCREGVFFVRDNGIGFDMQYHHKLFQPFERLHADSKYAGTGIGLANVKRIVEKHGGRVWAESELGNGATFFFSLAPSLTEVPTDALPG